MDNPDALDIAASLARLEQERVELERRMQQLTIDNRLATETEIQEALELADSLAALDTQIERLRRELVENSDRPTESRPH